MSGNEWPHDGLWPILIDEMNLKYKNDTFDSLEYYQALMNGSNTGWSAEMADQLQDYVSKNLLKVRRTLILLIMPNFVLKLNYV